MAVETTPIDDVGKEDDKQIADKGAYYEEFEQSTVAYTVASTTGGQVCASCRWFTSTDRYMPCHIVRNDPLPIVSGGHCDQWAMRPQADILLAEIISEVTEIENATQIDQMPAKSLLGQVWESKSIQPVLDYVGEALKPSLLPKSFGQSGFKSFGDNQWIAWYTNNFEDKEGEWFSNKAIEAFVKQVNDGLLELPELWYYHIRGTRAGVATKLFHVGHFLVALGEWDEKDKNAKVAPLQKWERKADTRLSHGFLYNPDTKKDGVYHDFATFEISLLDNGIEANPFTPFHSVKISEVNKIMEVTQVQKEALHAVFDKDMANEIINSADEGGKALDSAGIAYKETARKEDGISGETTLILGALAALNKSIQEMGIRAANDLEDEDDDKDKDKAFSDDSIALLHSFDSDMTTLVAAVRAMEERMEKFMAMTPRASKSPATGISDNDPHANHVHQKNYKGGLATEGLIGRAMKGAATLNGATPSEDDIPKPPDGK